MYTSVCSIIEKDKETAKIIVEILLDHGYQLGQVQLDKNKQVTFEIFQFEEKKLTLNSDVLVMVLKDAKDELLRLTR